MFADNKKLVGIIGGGILVLGASGTVIVDAQINPYLDEGTHYKLEIKNDIPQGERVEVHKDKAQMDLIGWNDEYKISIVPQIPTAQLGAIDKPFLVEANRPLLSKKVEFKSGEVTAFIEPKEGTENEFDIDFTLHSKPNTNVFEYKIEGAEEFDFFYQPALTQEEIAEGSSRPENVVGSYAVYHKTKANHRVGSTNYATGKAFHIYRPKVIDANGKEEWAEISYLDGVLSVTVPQKFLDDANFPVRVDPTFGYTSIGVSQSTGNSPRCGGAYLTTEAGDVTMLSIHQAAEGTGNLTGAIYSDSSSAPGSKLAEAASSADAVGWNDRTITYSVLNATNYQLCQWQSSGIFASASYDAAGSGFTGLRSGQTYNTWPDPFSETSTQARQFSIYATYTASAAASTNSSYQLIWEE